MNAPLDVRDVFRDGRHTLVLTGELDLASAPPVETLIRQLCVDSTRAIRLDLSELTFIDSTGLRVVLVAHELCEQHGYDFSITPGTHHVQRIFEMTGLLQVLPFVRSNPAQIDRGNALLR